MTLYRILDHTKDKFVQLLPCEVSEILTFYDACGEICTYIKVYSILESYSKMLYFSPPCTIEYLKTNVYAEELVVFDIHEYLTFNEELALQKFEELSRKYDDKKE